MTEKQIAVHAQDVQPRAKKSAYPTAITDKIGDLLAGREKRALGDAFGLTNFGVNLTRLAPGAHSALRHAHEKQDEFVYIIQGCPTLQTDDGDTLLQPGMCAGFPAGTGNAHRIINQSTEDVWYLEIGDRTLGDCVTYPEEDLEARNPEGTWLFSRTNGQIYE
ncbi:cupin domain-containing protein [Methylocucumis oryzae]|uniref:Cupin n=1 Tax=Methylocucumis oryzae TaxID=1632867 RepID=A0A0F3IKY4_9GAMM|nr:cupin domain-containing protein [Methylocucumis oryzae]KJV07183.1 cupin [Methylocucumis oryzae]